MNQYGKSRTPFFFVVDFLCKQTQLFLIDNIEKENIQIDFPAFKTQSKRENEYLKINIDKSPISFDEYNTSFQKIINEIKYGNSFLTNLTVATPIEIGTNKLDTIFQTAKAKYKILYKNEWVCFSPEIFVQMNEKSVSSFPMKGTIDASIENAHDKILNDEKEKAEHYTIVDLVRNDISMIAENVRVEKFRYIDEIKTAHKNLLQVSSKIVGDLITDFHSTIGTLFCTMLPAGSISGAPKKCTIESILKAETYNRNYYTGVAGIYDGTTLDSCVLIRFVEKTEDRFVYKSGGGITASSIAKNEYNEVLDKIYIPT
jgi:para-aminobenzoate synthetase component 1